MRGPDRLSKGGVRKADVAKGGTCLLGVAVAG
jgi:hypothetical protein